MNRMLPTFAAFGLVTLFSLAEERAQVAPKIPFIRIGMDQRSFMLEGTGAKFTPWGFNYDHDEAGRLLEDYWDKEWPKVEKDFRAMKRLGANVARVHLQFGKFMNSQDEANPKALDQLARLLRLAEETRLYLDLTGLGCYHKKDVPAWYDALAEHERWEAQARFWEAVAGRAKDSPAVFCYDLMNEPVVSGGPRKAGDWLGPDFAGSHFVQFVSLDPGKRARSDVAGQWIARLAKAIRTQDRKHLVTVGLVDWSLDRPGLTSGFVPKKIASELDFLCVHLYPNAKKVDDALETLQGFAIGKPVVIEETFPLHCSQKEFEEFMQGSEKAAAGWIGFFWGKTADEYRQSGKIGDALMANWLDYFEKQAKGR
jgi:hypothetical protein